jgi:hypothetical protein
MRVKFVVIVALLAAFVAGNVFGAAGDYLVYKTKNKISVYNEASEKKAEQMTVETYTVFEADKLAGDDTVDDPMRIVFFGNVGKIGVDTKTVTIVTEDGKNTKKMFINPLAFNYNPDGSIKDYGQYEGVDELVPYLPFAGPWSCECKQSDTFQFVLDYLDLEDGDGANADKHGEAYSGKLKVDKTYGLLASSLKGNLSYLSSGDVPATDWEIGIDSKGSLKFDKATTSVVISAGSLDEAVDDVLVYLTSKKYASTWTL